MKMLVESTVTENTYFDEKKKKAKQNKNPKNYLLMKEDKWRTYQSCTIKLCQLINLSQLKEIVCQWREKANHNKTNSNLDRDQVVQQKPGDHNTPALCSLWWVTASGFLSDTFDPLLCLWLPQYILWFSHEARKSSYFRIPAKPYKMPRRHLSGGGRKHNKLHRTSVFLPAAKKWASRPCQWVASLDGLEVMILFT